MFITNMKLEIISCDTNFEKFSGYKLDEIKNKHINMFIPPKYHNKHSNIKKVTKKLLEKMSNRQLTFLIKNNNIKHVKIFFNLINDKIVVHVDDITDIIELTKRYENQYTNISAISRKITHDIKTPIDGILSNCSLMEYYFNDYIKTKDLEKFGNRFKEIKSQMLELVKYQSNIIKDSLEYFKAQTLNNSDTITKSKTLLNNYFKNIIKLVNNIYKKDLVVLNSSFDDDIVLHTDLIKLKQIIINLLSNSYKYNKNNNNIFIVFI